MDDRRAARFGFDHPLEADGVRLGHVGTLDDDAVRVLQVLLENRRAAATEAGPQTGHRAAVSYPCLVLDLQRPERGEQLLDEVVLLVVQSGAAEAGESERAPGALALRLPLPGLLTGRDDAVGPGGELQARAALRAQPSAADRRVGIAFDLDDLVVLDVDVLATADRTV